MARTKPADESNREAEPRGRFAYEGLDRVLHEKARLGILTSLAAHSDGLLFNDLKQLCDLTDGNLSRHLRVLEQAELVEVWRGIQRRRPQTMYRLTKSGRQRFFDYVGVLQRVIEDAQATPARQAEDSTPLAKGWSPAD